MNWRRFVPARYHRSERLKRRLEAAAAGKILGGPFAGMRFIGRSYGSELAPKWLGTYELELREVIESAISRRPTRVIVLGAAEGYYAVGFAMRLPESTVVAFEARPEARAAIAEMAKANAVRERVAVHGLCSIGSLRRELGTEGRCLILCDLDGAESVLLDPDLVSELRRAELIVETHDCFVPGTVEALNLLFTPTHAAIEVRQRPRSVEDGRDLGLPREFRGALIQAMNERRPEENHWLHLLPR